MYQFRVDESALADAALPYFDDATSKNSQYHASDRTVEQAQEKLRQAMSRLGGAVVRVIPVIFETPERVGYIIEYVFAGGAFGQFPIAALPMRSKTETKKKRARVQALLIAADMLDAAANAKQHTPLANPLMLHLLVDGKHTLAQMIAERQSLPETFLLKAGDS